MDIGHMGIIEAASASVGNWLDFDSFGWADAPDPRYWTRAELTHRDSDELAQSNASAILRDIEAADPSGEDHFGVSASHWGFGYTDGICVRVYREGSNETDSEPTEADITPAFRTLWECAQSLADYPVLDESDYFKREHDALVEYLESEVSPSAIDRYSPDGVEYIPANEETFTEDLARVCFDDFSVCRVDDLPDTDKVVDAAITARLLIPDHESVAYRVNELVEERDALETRVKSVLEDYLRGLADSEDLVRLLADIESGAVYPQ